MRDGKARARELVDFECSVRAASVINQIDVPASFMAEIREDANRTKANGRKMNMNVGRLLSERLSAQN